MNNVAEQWKQINGYPDYEISSIGRCRSKDRVQIRRRVVNGKQLEEVIPWKGKILKPRYDTKGYVRYIIAHKKKRKQIKAHRCVVEHFDKPIPPGMQVNHIDGVKDNNDISNLEVCTGRENMIHAVKMGLVKIPDNRGERNGMHRVNRAKRQSPKT